MDEQGDGCSSISPASPDLLVVPVDTLGDAHVDYRSDVVDINA
jgi:hypothetical protein